MREENEEIERAGAGVIGVGMGTPAMAADASARERLPFPLLIDARQDLYRALQARRSGLLDLLRPSMFFGAIRAWRRGHRQSGVQGDPWQLGLTAVVDRAGEVVALRHARHAADHAPIEWILEAVRVTISR